MASLYFIAVMPPAGIQAEVLRFKKTIEMRWGPRHAFRSPAHITLVPPFELSSAKLPILQRRLDAFAEPYAPIDIRLSGFSGFAPKVLFIQPKPCPPLERLYRAWYLELGLVLGLEAPPKAFNPHMTLAHRDVPPDAYGEMLEYFRKIPYERHFSADALILLHLQNGQWAPVHHAYFKGSPLT